MVNASVPEVGSNSWDKNKPSSSLQLVLMALYSREASIEASLLVYCAKVPPSHFVDFPVLYGLWLARMAN